MKSFTLFICLVALVRDEREEADEDTVTFLFCLVVLIREVEESNMVKLVDYSECEPLRKCKPICLWSALSSHILGGALVSL